MKKILSPVNQRVVSSHLSAHIVRTTANKSNVATRVRTTAICVSKKFPARGGKEVGESQSQDGTSHQDAEKEIGYITRA